MRRSIARALLRSALSEPPAGTSGANYGFADGIGSARSAMGLFNTDSAEITSLRKLREAEAQCTRCPLYRDATQVVPGEGLTSAALMLVGEQPGTDEDNAGKPQCRRSRALPRSEEHTSELQSLRQLVCRLLLEKTMQGSRTQCR